MPGPRPRSYLIANNQDAAGRCLSGCATRVAPDASLRRAAGRGRDVAAGRRRRPVHAVAQRRAVAGRRPQRRGPASTTSAETARAADLTRAVLEGVAVNAAGCSGASRSSSSSGSTPSASSAAAPVRPVVPDAGRRHRPHDRAGRRPAGSPASAARRSSPGWRSARSTPTEVARPGAHRRAVPARPAHAGDVRRTGRRAARSSMPRSVASSAARPPGSDSPGLRRTRSLGDCGRHRLRRRDQAAPGDDEAPSARCSTSTACAPRSPTSASRSPRPTSGTTRTTPPASPAGSPRCRASSTASPSSSSRIERPRDHGRARPGRGRRRLARRGRGRARQGQEGRRGARGPHPARRRVRRPRGAHHDPLGRRWRRRRRLRRDADADVHALGRAAQVPRRGLRHVLRRGGRASSPPTFAIHAPYAYGTLSVEAGTHRLVRISPFDNQGRRQTSFAAVEVVPVLEQTDEIEIPDEDDPRRRLPLRRPRRPVGQHHRLRGPAHPHPDRHRRLLPEREVAAAEQGLRDGRPQGQAARDQEGRGGRELKELKGDVAGELGRPDAQLRAQPLPDRQGPAHRLRGRQPERGLRRRPRRLHRGRHPLAPRRRAGAADN